MVNINSQIRDYLCWKKSSSKEFAPISIFFPIIEFPSSWTLLTPFWETHANDWFYRNKLRTGNMTERRSKTNMMKNYARSGKNYKESSSRYTKVFL